MNLILTFALNLPHAIQLTSDALQTETPASLSSCNRRDNVALLGFPLKTIFPNGKLTSSHMLELLEVNL